MMDEKQVRAGRAVQAAALLAAEMPGRMAIPLEFRNELELLVGTILAAQSRDERVNKVIPVLFGRWPDAAAIAAAPREELQDVIKTTGFYNTKSKMIQECCRALVERHGGRVPVEMEALTALAGVGRKTANVVRSSCFGLPAIVVDTHMKRVVTRLGLTEMTDPDRIEQDVGELLPETEWSDFSTRVTWFGRRTCTAARPACGGCPLKGICPSAVIG
ncbi:MAG TPA: endonuclease III [Myxococcota bacterium]|nr:endonuclease III [Myxococcota bacterium]